MQQPDWIVEEDQAGLFDQVSRPLAGRPKYNLHVQHP
jgi:hypothetical protein